MQVDRTSASEWSGLLRDFDDASIYQSWDYGAVHWGEHQLSHLVVERDFKVIAVAQVRVVQLPLARMGVAYVRWGPLCRSRGEPFDPAVLRLVYQALREEYVRRRGLLLRVLAPVFVADIPAMSLRSVLVELGFVSNDRIDCYRTLRLDLTPPLEALRKGLDQKWRNCLNRAEKNSLTVKQGTGLELYDRFLEAYRRMRKRKQFETTVDVARFREMQRRLAEPLKLQTFLCEKEGRLLNAMVVSATGDTGIYLLGATSDEGLNMKGAYLLQWHVVRWLKEQGYRYYDLGGINPERNPGVFHFKQGLSGQDVRQLPAFELSAGRTTFLCVRAGEQARSLVSKLRSWAQRALLLGRV